MHQVNIQTTGSLISGQPDTKMDILLKSHTCTTITDYSMVKQMTVHSDEVQSRPIDQLSHDSPEACKVAKVKAYL